MAHVSTLSRENFSSLRDCPRGKREAGSLEAEYIQHLKTQSVDVFFYEKLHIGAEDLNPLVLLHGTSISLYYFLTLRIYANFFYKFS